MTWFLVFDSARPLKCAWLALPLAAALCCSCSHVALSSTDLNGISRVAFISRIEESAGPQSTVFRDDSSYRSKLAGRKIEDKEADRRLTAVLTDGTFEKRGGERELKFRTISRFELADGLRSQILSLLPPQKPWTSAVSPSEVASVLESFLVKEVPANEPDYERLKTLGADSVMEVVIEEYGMRSQSGKAGVFVRGYARLFRINGGQLYLRRFASDELKAGSVGQDPFAVAKNASLFVEHLRPILTAIAETVARDLTIAKASPEPQSQEPGKPNTNVPGSSGPKQFEEKREEVDPL
jgi:hypothetical protein